MFAKFLNILNLINDDNKVSITNIVVFVFVFITAFKLLFSGLIISTSFMKWTVQTIDVSSTLPLLFSLLNYGHKRNILNSNEKN